MNTTTCPSKATDNLILNVTSNLMNTDASRDLIQERLATNNSNLDLIIALFPMGYSHQLKKSYSKKDQCPSI